MPLAPALRRFFDRASRGFAHPSAASSEPVPSPSPAVQTTPGTPAFRHLCFVCHEPWCPDEPIAGGQDREVLDGLCSNPECERLYRRWAMSRTFAPIGGGGR